MLKIFLLCVSFSLAQHLDILARFQSLYFKYIVYIFRKSFLLLLCVSSHFFRENPEKESIFVKEVLPLKSLFFPLWKALLYTCFTFYNTLNLSERLIHYLEVTWNHNTSKIYFLLGNRNCNRSQIFPFFIYKKLLLQRQVSKNSGPLQRYIIPTRFCIEETENFRKTWPPPVIQYQLLYTWNLSHFSFYVAKPNFSIWWLDWSYVWNTINRVKYEFSLLQSIIFE